MEQTNFPFGVKHRGNPVSQDKWENYDNLDFDQFLQHDGHLNLNSNFSNTETTPLSLNMEMSLGCDGNMHQNNRSAMNMMNPFDSASAGSSAFRLGHALAQNHSGNGHSYTPSTNSMFSHQSIDPLLFQTPPGLDLSLPNFVSSDLPNPAWNPAMYGDSMGNEPFESLDRELFGCDAALSGMFSPSPSPSPVKPNLLANAASTNEGTVKDIFEDILSLAAPVSESSLRAEAPPDPVTPTRPRSNKRTRSSKNANPDIAPATPVAVGSGSLLTPPKSGKSASPATKRRKCNTPSKPPKSTPKKPRKVTTKSTPKKAPKRKAPEHDIDEDGDSQPEPELKTEPQLSPEEILGFSWNYVQQMQLQDQGLALTKYQSLEEANAAQWDLQLETIPDVTIPTTIHEKKVLVNLIIGASRDVTVATDGERVMTPWRNNSYSREQLERGAWALLVSKFNFFPFRPVYLWPTCF